MATAIRPPYAHDASLLAFSAFYTGTEASRQWHYRTINGVAARMMLRGVHQPLAGSHYHAASAIGSRGSARRANLSPPTTFSSSVWLHFRGKRHHASTARKHPTLPVIVAHASGDQHQQAHHLMPRLDDANGVIAAVNYIHQDDSGRRGASNAARFRLPSMENQTSGDLAVTTETASSSATRAFPRPPLPVLAGSSMLAMALLLYYLYIREKSSDEDEDKENGMAKRRDTLAKQGAERLSTLSHQATEKLSAVREKLGFPDTAPGEKPEPNDERDELKATTQDTGAAPGSLVESGMAADEPPVPKLPKLPPGTSVDTTKTSREEATETSYAKKPTSKRDPLSVPPEDPEQKIYGAFQVERPIPEPVVPEVVPEELDPEYVKETLMTDDAENPAKSPKWAD